MMSMPTALVLSAGGYHRHVGTNTWRSRNAPRRDPDATGLKSYAYLIQDEAGWLVVLDRVKDKNPPPQSSAMDSSVFHWKIRMACA